MPIASCRWVPMLMPGSQGNTPTNKTTNDDDYVSCFDVPRTELHHENAVTSFLNRFAADPSETTIQSEDRFDVIIESCPNAYQNLAL